MRKAQTLRSRLVFGLWEFLLVLVGGLYLKQVTLLPGTWAALLSFCLCRYMKQPPWFLVSHVGLVAAQLLSWCMRDKSPISSYILQMSGQVGWDLGACTRLLASG